MDRHAHRYRLEGNETLSDVLLIDIILLVLVAMTAGFVVQVRSLFAAVMASGIYSLLMALVWANMHALDVAFTEASVGAGITTVLLLGALARTDRWAKKAARAINLPALLICLFTGGMLIYGTLDMPAFGDPQAPIHTERVPKLLAQRVGKVPDGHVRKYAPPDPAHLVPNDDFGGHVPNTVTSLLAAYRGYDTMFETTVIFVAGVGMVLLLRRRRDDEQVPEPENRDSAEPESGAEASGDRSADNAGDQNDQERAA